MRISDRKTLGISQFIGESQGATLMEYALLAALASVIVVIALLAFFRT